jgi:hypothetical protein
MKKFLLIFAAVLLLFASCEGPAGHDGLDGNDFEFYVENFTVRSGDWKYVSEGRYTTLYQCIVKVEIGGKAYEDGIVEVYMFQTDNGSEVQTPLPYWMQHTVGENTWLEGYNYDFDDESVAFYAEVEKGTIPLPCYFRVVIAP